MLSREFAPRDRFALAATTIAIAALATLGAGLGYAQNPDTLPSSGWVVLSETSPWSEPPHSEILISALDSISLTVDVHGFEVEPVNHGSDAFQKLSLLGRSFTRETGRPEIPVVRMMLAIPDCESYSLNVVQQDSTEFACGAVWPVPGVAVGYQDEYEYTYETYTLDEDFYQGQAFYPGESAVIAEDGWIRDQRYVILEIHPIRYSPGLSRLRCYSSVSICISFANPVETNVQGVGPFESICQSVMENYEGVDGGLAAGGRGDTCAVSTDWFSTVTECAYHSTDYLMIVEDSIIDVDTIDALAEKKSWYDCLNVAMVKVSDIASPISPQAIKDFIQDLYETQTAANVPDHHLGYVLLIGDAREAANPSQGQSQELLPAYEDSLCFGLGMDCWVPTDQWYACVSGDDYLQDLAIGRLAVGDTTELQTIASKIIGYEPVPLSESWANDVFLSCSFAQGDDGLLYHRGQVHKTELPEILDILEDEAVDIDTLHVHTYSCSIGQLPLCAHNQYGRPQNRAAVDDGKLVVLLWGHGYPCGSLSFKAKDVPLLDNAGMLPFWINMSCSTGNFANLACECGPSSTSCDCLGEFLLHWGDVGAVAFFGATKAINGHYLGPRVIDSLYDQSNPMIGQAICEAKVRHYIDGYSLREMCACNLLGDPTLNLFFGDETGYGGASDLVVSEWDVEMSPEQVNRGDEVTFECRVTNEGPESTGSDSVAVAFDLYHGDGSLAASITDMLQPMDDWGADTARAVWTAHVDSIGAYDLFVTVDPENLIEELHEWNNTTAPIHFYVQWNYEGFPISLGTSGEIGASPVTVCNITGDEDQEIVASYDSGKVAVISPSGQVLWSWAPSGAPLWAACPAVADFDSDGTPEIAVVVRGLEPGTGTRDDWIYVLNSEGRASRVWKQVVVGETYSAPLAIDLDPVDGRPEVAVVGVDESEQGRLSVWDFAPATPACSWHRPLGSDSAWERTSPPTAVNMGLHPADLVTWDYSPDDTLIVCRSAAGLLEWQLSVPDFGGQRGFGVAAGDLDGYGEVLLASARASDGLLLVHTSTSPADTLWTAAIPGTSEVVIGNVDSDEELEIVCAGGCSVFVFNQYRTERPVWRAGLAGTAVGEPLIGDFDGGDDVEIIVGAVQPDGNSLLYILSVPAAPGTLETVVDPVEVPGTYITGALCDLDGNGKNDIVFTTNKGVLYRFEYWGASNPRFEWPMYRHDERNSGLYEQPVLGTLTQSTTWSGDMFIRGDVEVPDTLTLCLAAGTKIEVAHDADEKESGRDTTMCELIVEGALLSRGGALRRVTFTPDELPLGAPPDWYGITLEPGSTCSLAFTDVSGAYKSLWVMVPDALDVRDSRFLSQSMMGVHLEGCEAPTAVADCTIDEAYIGIRADSCATHIGGNTITGARQYGIHLYDDRGCTVDDNEITVVGTGPAPLATPCAIYCSNRFDTATIGISDNTIDMGDISGEGIFIYAVPAASPSIDGNEITGAGGETGSSKGIRLVKTPAVARGNRLSDFRYHFYVETETGQIPNLGDTTDPGGNATDDNALYNVYAWAQPPVDPLPAQLNWWGTDHPTARKFVGAGISIEWEPFLDEDPNSREGQHKPDGAVAWYDLDQNRPNPFNPMTAISYAVPKESRVRIAVYDLSGRVVRVLLDDMRPPGEHSVAWDGRNEQGLPVGSGVYFCRMEAGSFRESRKLVVLK